MTPTAAALLIAVLALWAPPGTWAAAVVGVVLVGFLAGILHWSAGLWLLALAVSASALRDSHGWLRGVWFVLTAVVALLLGLHVLPGFSNPIVIREAILAQSAEPYTQYLNFDKTLGGVVLLGCSGWAPFRSWTEWRVALRRALPIILLTVVVAMGASLALGFVRFDPHWTPLFWLWAPINLLTTCVSEEAFFRWLIQTELTRQIRWTQPLALGTGALDVHAGRFPRTQTGDVMVVTVSAALFGLAHIAGGWTYALLAGLAGAGYALVYQRTNRLEMSTLTHFSVNLVHFLLFTYPARVL